MKIKAANLHKFCGFGLLRKKIKKMYKFRMKHIAFHSF